MEKKKANITRWLILVGYLSVFLILTLYHVHMYNFNSFLITITISTVLLVVLLWFLREKKGERLSTKD